MNIKNAILELKEKYPDKRLIQIPKYNSTEIICELEPSTETPEKSVAIAVIDRTRAHFHQKGTEVYEVLRGRLILTINGTQHELLEGETYTVLPLDIHSAKGKATWVRVTSTPGWTQDDHIFV